MECVVRFAGIFRQYQLVWHEFKLAIGELSVLLIDVLITQKLYPQVLHSLARRLFLSNGRHMLSTPQILLFLFDRLLPLLLLLIYLLHRGSKIVAARKAK